MFRLVSSAECRFICAHASVSSSIQVIVESPTTSLSPSQSQGFFDEDQSLFFCPLQKSHSLPATATPIITRPTSPSGGTYSCGLKDTPSVMLSSSLDTSEVSYSASPANSISALIVAPPSADAFFRAHRHSIPDHRLTNYLKFLHELAAQGSTIAQLFSTAVISGSSMAPNLQKEMPPRGENVGKFIFENRGK